MVAVACAALSPWQGVRFAHGAESENADELISEGLALRRAGRDEVAIAEFQKAYRLAPTPRASSQLGLCEQALGRWSDAEEHISVALEKRDDIWVNKNRATLESALSVVKTHVARVEIASNVDGAEVLVGGHLVGKTPLTTAIRVNGGTVDLEARAPGFKTALRTLVLVGGQYQQVSLYLEAVHLAPTEAPMQSGVIDRPANVDSTGSSTSTPIYKRTWLWVAVGALALAGAGVAILVTNAHNNYPNVPTLR